VSRQRCLPPHGLRGRPRLFLFAARGSRTIPPLLTGALWQPRSPRTQHTAPLTEAQVRRGHRYFIDEFLDHIGAPMGTKAPGAP